MRNSTTAVRVRLAAVVVLLGALPYATVLSGEAQTRAQQVPCFAAAPYPGDRAPKTQLARWMAEAARAAGLPPELPVMAALVDSGLRNRSAARGDADSVGYFQMRTSIWSVGEYKGFATNPQLQMKWFIDHAIAVKVQRYARRPTSIDADPSLWGQWIADVERPAEHLRGRYQLRLAEARALLRTSGP